ncbi:unnamed protein product [Anisakis simplex]|uniref:Serine/arginine-rich splicing factor 2 n=1 Tax=Anisakis simplex TaxID=6269 RepID=A0A0M3K154_ANISI|nr:unnamed protein product [Anisakis simplex]
MRLTILRAVREALSTSTSNHTLHVSNLSWVTSKKQLLDYFSQFGKIKNVTVPLDQRLGVNRGFAFVEFEDEQSLKKAFTAGQFHEIDETNVRLSRNIGASNSNE